MLQTPHLSSPTIQNISEQQGDAIKCDITTKSSSHKFAEIELTIHLVWISR